MAHLSNGVVDLLVQVREQHQHELEAKTQDKPAVPLQDSPHPSQVDSPNNHAHFRSPPTTPSMRTGPPRSLSYVYSLPNSPAGSRANSKPENNEPKLTNHEEEEGSDFPFSEQHIPFRGALETGNGSFSSDRKGKKRESRLLEESWNPIKWFHESPKDEVAPDSPFGRKDGTRAEPEDDAIGPSLRRVRTEEPVPSPDTQKASRAKWGRLRSLLPQVANQNPSPGPGPSAVTSSAVNITDELITGGLSTLMLRLWFEHDEKGHRRVPVLLHRLRLRVSDSLHPLQGHKSVFRIECEYANGAARWVVYRQLRDFLSLHTHYAVSNAYNRNVDGLPEFPRTSLPYFKFLLKEGREKGTQVGHADFARLQREALENYLLDLIRAVMFHPASNRLCGFLEISALSISHAQTGGSQYKGGYLQIEAANGKGGGFGRKSASWKAKKESRWCAIRESYLVVMKEPGELEVWDVFMLDPDFTIERPKRYYRQGLNLLHPDTLSHEKAENGDDTRRVSINTDTEHMSLMGSIRGRVSQVLHFGNHPRARTTSNVGRQGNHDDDASSGSSRSSVSSRATTPMLDPSTHVNPLQPAEDETMIEEHPWTNNKKKKKANVREVSKHTFFITNSQMRLKLFARNQRQMLQWITAFEKAAAASHYTGGNRFESFAPIRLNVATQWLVDGRDYFWNLSRAILMAKENIYIHDWWLSPELQLRRPNKDRYRLDKLLESKAREGVKIFIILYQEVSSRTTPTDSNYSKQRLTALHPNIMVQRSPSHFQTGTFYWAHHEKLCVIDQAIAFMGGLDLCFGRWDTSQHVLIDDPDGDHPQIWPGKDYSNARVSDFFTLNKPEEDMYDRTRIPRMPWHDVGLQVVGQPARDLARHFVQRWNYLLRIKNHSRTMPFLLPPPEFKPGELTHMGLTGTCEMQICRSAGPWSMGTPSRIEHSIQNAYLKAIQMSEHFVYFENQFFITSTVVNDVKIENKIGDALVHRILRAHRDGTPWKCCIVIPVLPGFVFPVDHSDASALRIILECQNRTFARGPHSIFARLRKEGIDPDDHITIFSLRNWGKLRGEVLTTEQVYIHGKVCIVDDRLAIIGSANVNERSQRGDRDSEIAAVIRDTDMIDGTMAGKPFQVGRFAHTLRKRLMREHLGVDVDAIYEEDLMANDPQKAEHEQETWDPESEQHYGKEAGVTKLSKARQRTPAGSLLRDGLDEFRQALHATGEAGSQEKREILHKLGLSKDTAGKATDATLKDERQMFTRDGKEVPGFTSAMVPTLEEKTVMEHHLRSGADHEPIADKSQEGLLPESDQKPQIEDSPNDDMSSKDGSVLQTKSRTVLANDPSADPRVDGELYGAPADASTSPETDNQPPHARSNVDDADEQERAAPPARSIIRKQLKSKLGNKWTLPTPRPKVDPQGFDDPVCDEFWKDVWVATAVHNTEIFRKVFHAVPDDLVTTWKQYKEFVIHHERLNKPVRDGTTPDVVGRVPSETGDEDVPLEGKSAQVDEREYNHSGPIKDGEETEEMHLGATSSEKDPKTRRPARGIEGFEKWERDEMEALLGELNGHLVIYPTRFLEGEDAVNNFLFNADRLLPLPIYN
ncbi:phospholipase D [Lentinula aciculospora]|uniref:Phospholipase n=1 Tax=Lentinula aciculospora TaxID=153920 RepID=A0A9W9AGJ8_9AGAR|nr:phospholipase D [Lentinula aciculospora]